MAAIKVRLVSGLSQCPADHRITVVGMGLKKFNSEKILPDTPATMGMIHKVSYLVEWEKVDAPAPLGRKARKAAAAKNKKPAPAAKAAKASKTAAPKQAQP